MTNALSFTYLLFFSKPHTFPTKAAHGSRQTDETSSGVEISEWIYPGETALKLLWKRLDHVGQQQMTAFTIF